MQKKLISAVIPVYNEEVYLETYFAKLSKYCDMKNFEIVFVNDGSTDYSIRILQKIADENLNVKIVTLAKNYGKQIAITAGMKQATGDAVIVLSVKDGEPFSAINEMINAHFKGAEIVRGYFKQRLGFFGRMREKVKNLLLKSAMFVFGVRGKLVLKPDAELYDRNVVDIINQLPEKNMFLRRTQSLFGFKETQIVFEPAPATQKEKQVFKERVAEFEKQRKEEAIGEPVKSKRRLYAPSLWVSYGAFVSFGFLLLTLFVLLSLNVHSIVIAFTLLLMAGSVLICAIYLARAVLIKTLGILFFLKKGESLYEIKSLTNF